MADTSSSSSDPFDAIERLVLDHTPDFKSYSLDPQVVEDYYNKGRAARASLTPLSSSSSSDGPTQATIEVELKDATRPITNPDRRIPDDLQFHLYDQGPATALPQKTPGEDRITITVLSPSWPASFQINVEHPSYKTAAVTLEVPEPGLYYASITLGNRTYNERRRITEAYRDYLLGWLQDFWTRLEGGQQGLVEDFLHPAPDHPLNPFEHAIHRLAQDHLAPLAASHTGELRAQTATRNIINKRNFLGVGPDMWDCIVGKGVDNNSDKLWRNAAPTKYSDEEWPALVGKWMPFDAFNCRAFSVAAARQLRTQLKSLCPKSEVKNLITPIRRHALNYVEIGDCGDDPDCNPECCDGSNFVYEPQSGQTWDGGPEFDDDVLLWGGEAELDSYFGSRVGTSPDASDWAKDNNRIDWHMFPQEVERITNLVCGCLDSPLALNPMETYMKQKCQDFTFGSWFMENFRQGEGLTETTDPNMPQFLSCATPRKCQKSYSSPIDLGALATECNCQEDPDGELTPEECQSYCAPFLTCSGCGSANCLKNSAYDPPFHTTEQECLEACQEKTKTLYFGTAEDWFGGRLGDRPAK